MSETAQRFEMCVYGNLTLTLQDFPTGFSWITLVDRRGLRSRHAGHYLDS